MLIEKWNRLVLAKILTNECNASWGDATLRDYLKCRNVSFFQRNWAVLLIGCTVQGRCHAHNSVARRYADFFALGPSVSLKYRSVLQKNQLPLETYSFQYLWVLLTSCKSACMIKLPSADQTVIHPHSQQLPVGDVMKLFIFFLRFYRTIEVVNGGVDVAGDQEETCTQKQNYSTLKNMWKDKCESRLSHHRTQSGHYLRILVYQGWHQTTTQHEVGLTEPKPEKNSLAWKQWVHFLERRYFGHKFDSWTYNLFTAV